MSRFVGLGRHLFWSMFVVIAVTASFRIAHAEVTQAERRVSFIFEAPDEGVTNLFFSEDAKWTRDESKTLPSLAGLNEISFSVPSTTVGLLRWDIGNPPGTYVVRSVTVDEDGQPMPIPIDSIVASTAGVPGQTIIVSGADIIIQDDDGNPRLLIDLTELGLDRDPPVRLRVTLAVIALTLLASVVALRQGKIGPAMISVGFVLWLYGAFYYYVAKWAPRIPYWDDWRYLTDLDATGKLPLTVSRMFTPFNDTLYATGKLLDTLILNSTNFSFYTLQMFGVSLLGLFIVLMIVLVRRVTGRIAPQLTNLATLTVGFTLVGQSYWLQPAVAYHQFLPLLFGVAIIVVLDRARLNWAHTVLITVFSLLAGFAYISGAFLVLAMGITYATTYYQTWRRGSRTGTLPPALALIATGVVAVVSQLGLVARSQGSVFAASSVADTAYPWTLDFWAFYLGIASRAVGKAGAPIMVAGAITLALLALPVLLASLGVHRGASNSTFQPRDAFPLLFASILVPFYLGIVSAGRGLTLGRAAVFPDVMALGAARFHFWWAAALLPLLWVAWHRVLERLKPRLGASTVAVFTLLTVLLVVPASPAPWHYPSVFTNRLIAFERTDACISSNVTANNFDFVCQHISSGNIGPSVEAAYDFGLSFISEAGLPARPSLDD